MLSTFAVGVALDRRPKVLYQEQFEGGRVQWRCTDGDIMADGTIGTGKHSLHGWT